MSLMMARADFTGIFDFGRLTMVVGISAWIPHYLHWPQNCCVHTSQGRRGSMSMPRQIMHVSFVTGGSPVPPDAAANLRSQWRRARGLPVEGLLLPDLQGLEVRVAAARLHTLGLNVELLGSGRVIRQEPSAGARVVRGAIVLLR